MHAVAQNLGFTIGVAAFPARSETELLNETELRM